MSMIPNPNPYQFNNGEEEDPQDNEQNLQDSLRAAVGGGGGGGEANLAQSLLQLPLDIFLDIFTSLPIKSMAISRCVCKAWYKILYHSLFIKLEYSKAIQQPQHVFSTSTGLIIHNGTKALHFLQHEKDGNLDNVLVFNLGFDDPDVEFSLVGSCNGLLCVVDCTRPDPLAKLRAPDELLPVKGDPGRLYVCNPVTGECMKLPQLEKLRTRGTISSFGFDEIAREFRMVRLISSCFGFDEVAKEYKAVQIFCCSSYNVLTNSYTLKLNGAIHTLGSGKWRNLGNVPYWFAPKQLFFNGAFHWFVSRETFLSFDLGREEFRVIEGPLGLTPTGYQFGLGKVGRKLSLSHHWSDDWCDIWLMKDYGVRASWSKEYIISRNVAGIHTLKFTNSILMEDGNILFWGNKCLLCYDTTSNTLSKLENGKIPSAFSVTPHVPSFISFRDVIGTTN